MCFVASDGVIADLKNSTKTNWDWKAADLDHATRWQHTAHDLVRDHVIAPSNRNNFAKKTASWVVTEVGFGPGVESAWATQPSGIRPKTLVETGTGNVVFPVRIAVSLEAGEPTADLPKLFQIAIASRSNVGHKSQAKTYPGAIANRPKVAKAM